MESLFKFIDDALNKKEKRLLISVIALFPFAYTYLYFVLVKLAKFEGLGYFEQIIFSVTISSIYVVFTAFGSVLVEDTFGKKSNVLGVSIIKGCLSIFITILWIHLSFPLWFLLTLLVMVAILEIIVVLWNITWNKIWNKIKNRKNIVETDTTNNTWQQVDFRIKPYLCKK